MQTGCTLSRAYRQCSYSLSGVNELVLFQTPSICVRSSAMRAAVGPARWPPLSDADVAPRPRWAGTSAEHVLFCVTPKIWKISSYSKHPPAADCGGNSVWKILSDFSLLLRKECRSQSCMDGVNSDIGPWITGMRTDVLLKSISGNQEGNHEELPYCETLAGQDSHVLSTINI